MSYLGVPPFGQTVRTITESLATAGQTTFSPSGGYLPGYIDVFLNGSALGAADFTATNGSTVVLNVAAALNDEFKAIAYWPVSLIDTYRKAEADALLAARVGTTSSVSMRNRIINGEMRIDQRNAGASVTVSTNVFVTDRFLCDMGGLNNYTAQRSSTAPAGFTNSLLMTMGTGATIDATDYAFLRQAIEGFNTADLALGTANASPFTLSFWVRSSVTGTFGVSFRNSAANTTYCATYAINSANVWEYKTVAVPAITSGTWLTDNGAGMFVFWDLGVGSTFSGTANQLNTGSNFFGVTGTTKLAATTGATFYITGVQLEAGSVASPFERRDYGRELMMCQRYCWVINSTGQDTMWGSGRWEGNLGYIQLVYPVVMRSQPSISLSTASGLQLVDPAVAWHNVTAFNGIHKNGLRSMDAAFLTGTSITAGRATILAVNSGSPTATISAEL